MAQWNVRSVLEAGAKDLSESDKVVIERYGEFCRSTMPGSSPKQQFDAAVQLIRGLPKDGPFQPSNDMKLRLYGFFKQATEGPCTQPAPSFWDVIGKAKWGAWKNLGDMPADRAMTSYVEEIKKVMETMSLTDDVANLMDTLGPVYEYVDDERNAGGRSARKKHVHFSADIEPASTNGHGGHQGHEGHEGHEGHVVHGGHIDSPEEETTPEEAGSRPVERNGVTPPPAAGEGNGEVVTADEQHQHQQHQHQTERWNGSATSDTDDDDEFNDPIGEAESVPGRRDDTEARLNALHHQLMSLTRMMDAAGTQIQQPAGGPVLSNGSSSPVSAAAAPVMSVSSGASICPGVHDELRALVRDMRDDLDTVTGRLRYLEANHSGAESKKSVVTRPWWQVPELSPRSVLLLLAWPLVLQLVLRLITARRRRQ